MNRVVIIGYGATSPIGNNVDNFLNSLEEGTNGIAPITKFDASETRIILTGRTKDFLYDKYFIKKDSKRMDMLSIYGIYAALEAMEMNGLGKEKMNQGRFGVIIGSGIDGLPTIENQAIRLHEKSAKRVSPMFIPMATANMTTGDIALHVGAKGIRTATVTVCASGTNLIGEAFRNTKRGYSDVIPARGTETTICEMGITGFAVLTVLSESTDPSRGPIPFDESRNGFVMGGGASVLVLEFLEHVRAHDAKIYGEVVGYGVNYDAYHMTTPTPDGSGTSKAIELAMEEAGVQSEQVGYINAHGTSAPANDQTGAKTVQIALGENLEDTCVSSTKSMTGHLSGTAGGIEASATLLALEHQFIPPTINVEKQDPETDLTVVRNKNKPASLTYAMSNSLGFGRHNAVPCMKRWEE